MDKMLALLEEADSLMDQAESVISGDFGRGVRLFQQAITKMEQAYLMPNGEIPFGDLSGLFEKCRAMEPDFEQIADEIAFLAAITSDTTEDPDAVCDTANEIWDFMYGIMEEP